MNHLFLKLYIKFQDLTNSERGQDLVEYALLCSLIVLTLITGMKSIATAVNNAFTNISSSLA